MASELLKVPEEHLAEVIKILRVGLLNARDVTPVVNQAIKDWCDEEEAYLKRLKDK